MRHDNLAGPHYPNPCLTASQPQLKGNTLVNLYDDLHNTLFILILLE